MCVDVVARRCGRPSRRSAILCHSDASQAPLAAARRAGRVARRAAPPSSVRRSTRTSRAIVWAVGLADRGDPFGVRRPSIPGSACMSVAARCRARLRPRRDAGCDDETRRTRAHRRARPTRRRRVAARGDERGEPLRADERERRPRAAHTTKSAARIATFVANSVVCGAISTVARSPTPTAYTRRPERARGDRLRVGDHEEEEDEDLGRGDEEPPELPALDRPDMPGGRHRVTARGEHADARREGEPEADRDPDEVEPPEDEEAADDDQHECDDERGRQRPPPQRERIRALGAEEQEAEHEAEVRRVEDVPSANADQVLRQQRHRRRAGEDPPALRAPPVAVLRAWNA